MLPIGFDTETHLIKTGCIAPKIVCLSTYDAGEMGLFTEADQNLDAMLDILFKPDGINRDLVGHRTSYDLGVISARRSDLLPCIFEMLAQGKIHDTLLREKLIVLADTGDLEYLTMPNGSKSKRAWKLANLVMDYFGIDLTAEKNADDSWRLNYAMLDGQPINQWPTKAIEYPVDDAKYVVDLYEKQEEKAAKISERLGINILQTEGFRVAVDFCLQLMTIRGTVTDHKMMAQIEAMLTDELQPAKLKRLLDSGILRPGSPPRALKNGAKVHLAICTDPKNCNCPPKMTGGVEESINKKKLIEHVEHLKRVMPDDIELTYTDKGNLQVDKLFLEKHWHLDPILGEYQHRQKLQKLVTTELPRMKTKDENGNLVPSPVVHPYFDALKETGRVSSYGDDLVASFNCQNVDPRVRGCYIPRDGFDFCSTDFSAMELVSDAQTMLDLFGESVLADKLKAGIDPHAYLAAQLAYVLDQDFNSICNQEGKTRVDEIYDLFQQCAKSEHQSLKDFFKHYRKFAKPTGLGYPGGLGPKTFIQYAKATYQVDVTFEQATQFREVWRATYPEKVRFFDWLTTEAIDRHNGPVIRKMKDKDGNEVERTLDVYCYTTPLGMHRAGCDYCAAANGKCLQSPSAEGALLALFEVTRACYDPTRKSILYGECFPIFFIHDEIISEVRNTDPVKRDAVCREKARIMADAFNQITPDVHIKAQPVLMRRWDKAAEPVFDEKGLLVPWEKKTETGAPA